MEDITKVTVTIELYAEIDFVEFLNDITKELKVLHEDDVIKTFRISIGPYETTVVRRPSKTQMREKP